MGRLFGFTYERDIPDLPLGDNELGLSNATHAAIRDKSTKFRGSAVSFRQLMAFPATALAEAPQEEFTAVVGHVLRQQKARASDGGD